VSLGEAIAILKDRCEAERCRRLDDQACVL
jgi:hypothetical protein